MPRPPGIIDRVNYIIDFAEHPCQAPWTVYVETALPVAGELLMSFVTAPDPVGVAANYFRPKGIRAAAKGRRKKKSGKKLLTIPDVDELTAEHLPGRDKLKARVVSKGVKHLWLVEGVIERLTWYWFLFDLLTEGLYDWTTTIQRSEYCRKAGLPGAHAESDRCLFGGIGTWLPYGPQFAKWTSNGATYAGGAIFTPVDAGLLIASLKWTNGTGHAVTVELGWDGFGEITGIDSATVQHGETASLMATRSVGRSGLYTPKARCQGLQLAAAEGTVDLF